MAVMPTRLLLWTALFMFVLSGMLRSSLYHIEYTKVSSISRDQWTHVPDQQKQRDLVLANSSSNSTKSAFVADVTPSKFCLVHVGKTAGGTVSCHLAGTRMTKKRACNRTVSSHSIFAQSSVSKLHKNQDHGCFGDGNDPPKTFVFTLRHPVDRIVSWFYYEHPQTGAAKLPMTRFRQALYMHCFSTMEDLVSNGLRKAWKYHQEHFKSNSSTSFLEGDDVDVASDDQSLQCALHAWWAIRGDRHYGSHNYYNYKHYESMVAEISGNFSDDYQIMVIRSEHLQKDWDQLEALWRRQPLPLAEKQTLASEHNGTEFGDLRVHAGNYQSLDPALYPLLCRTLHCEIQVYKRLVDRAKNLLPEQKHETLEELYAKCPDARFDTDLMSCPEPYVA